MTPISSSTWQEAFELAGTDEFMPETRMSYAEVVRSLTFSLPEAGEQEKRGLAKLLRLQKAGGDDRVASKIRWCLGFVLRTGANEGSIGHKAFIRAAYDDAMGILGAGRCGGRDGTATQDNGVRRVRKKRRRDADEPEKQEDAEEEEVEAPTRRDARRTPREPHQDPRRIRQRRTPRVAREAPRHPRKKTKSPREARQDPRRNESKQRTTTRRRTECSSR